jgi:TetR/AcrR family transcriptional repressor of nem operon
MPWEKQFNEDEALKDAMQTFWSRGYDATSLQDLVESMGINRGSIYATFGDKHSLFLEALKRYDEVERKDILANIRKGRSPRKAIQSLFDELIMDTVVNKNRDGCFLVNSALEIAPHDEDVAKIVSSAFEDIERFFRDLIKEGQVQGEISKDINVRDVARMLLATLIGIRVISRSWPEKSILNSIASQALRLLE